jgi:hypothetical protein
MYLHLGSFRYNSNHFLAKYGNNNVQDEAIHYLQDLCIQESQSHSRSIVTHSRIIPLDLGIIKKGNQQQTNRGESQQSTHTGTGPPLGYPTGTNLKADTLLTGLQVV